MTGAGNALTCSHHALEQSHAVVPGAGDGALTSWQVTDVVAGREGLGALAAQDEHADVRFAFQPAQFRRQGGEKLRRHGVALVRPVQG